MKLVHEQICENGDNLLQKDLFANLYHYIRKGIFVLMSIHIITAKKLNEGK